MVLQVEILVTAEAKVVKKVVVVAMTERSVASEDTG